MTNGILRKLVSSATNFTVLSNNAKSNSQGDSPWATDRYLNVWTTPNLTNISGGNSFGYGQFPSDYASSPSTDGVVVVFDAFGRGAGTNAVRMQDTL